MAPVTANQSADAQEEGTSKTHGRRAKDQASRGHGSTKEGGNKNHGRGGGPLRASPNPPDASAGSHLHEAGRCKPCAFYHTKGCNSGTECEFCHLCPPHEKARRKRLRRQLCNSILYSRGELDTRARAGNFTGKVFVRQAGHLRTDSGASLSTTCTTATGSTPSHGQHSRQWSLSTQDGSQCLSPVSRTGPQVTAAGKGQAAAFPTAVPETAETLSVQCSPDLLAAANPAEVPDLALSAQAGAGGYVPCTPLQYALVPVQMPMQQYSGNVSFATQPDAGAGAAQWPQGATAEGSSWVLVAPMQIWNAPGGQADASMQSSAPWPQFWGNC